MNKQRSAGELLTHILYVLGLIAVTCVSFIVGLLLGIMVTCAVVDEPQKPVITSGPIVKIAPTPTSMVEPTVEKSWWTDGDADILAKMLYGEARGIPSDAEKAATIWCVLNRVDAQNSNISKVVTAPNQFVGYRANNPVVPALREIAVDTLNRWVAEKNGCLDSGRVLPADYLYFHGDGQHNHFRKEFLSTEYWDWSLPNPYDS